MLSDNEAHDALLRARRELGEAPGATTRARAALDAARRILSSLAAALLIASEVNGRDGPQDGPPPP